VNGLLLLVQSSYLASHGKKRRQDDFSVRNYGSGREPLVPEGLFSQGALTAHGPIQCMESSGVHSLCCLTLIAMPLS
jgi:hypothetical protein